MTDQLPPQNVAPDTQPNVPNKLHTLWTIVIGCVMVISVLAVVFVQNSKNVQKNAQVPSPTVQPSIVQKRDIFSDTQNIKRRADIKALADAIELYENERGILPPDITEQVQLIAKSEADICADISPAYIAALPRDPEQQFDPNNPYSKGGSIINCNESYNTGYTIKKNTETSFTIYAPMNETMEEISITR